MTSAPLQKRVVWTLSFGHLMNDMLTSVVSAVAPLLVLDDHFTYGQVGLVALVANLTSSVSQPIFGALSDKKPIAWLLAVSVFLTGLGTAGLSVSHSFAAILAAVALCGLGSAVFHPEAARAAHLAAGDRKGLAQSIFQVGGNLGFALGPLVVATYLVKTGIQGTAWLVVPGAAAAAALGTIVKWYHQRVAQFQKSQRQREGENRLFALLVLLLIITIRSWVQLGIVIYLPLYYIDRHLMAADMTEWSVFVFLLAGAVGTFLGGPMSDTIGKKRLISGSMVLAVPLSLLIPHVSGTFGIMVLLGALGFVILASFAVGVVYGQELVPRHIGMVSGLIIGLSVGAGGIGASVLGQVADAFGISTVLAVISWLPLVGALLTLLLPKEQTDRRPAQLSA
jgi:FSR family fosmidomycin resistance protein-like MFS transporter